MVPCGERWPPGSKFLSFVFFFKSLKIVCGSSGRFLYMKRPQRKKRESREERGLRGGKGSAKEPVYKEGGPVPVRKLILQARRNLPSQCFLRYLW